jgi:hypothetical protein
VRVSVDDAGDPVSPVEVVEVGEESVGSVFAARELPSENSVDEEVLGGHSPVSSLVVDVILLNTGGSSEVILLNTGLPSDVDSESNPSPMQGRSSSGRVLSRVGSRGTTGRAVTKDVMRVVPVMSTLDAASLT